MKCEVIISSKNEEKVIVYAKERNDLVSSIEALVKSYGTEINGYTDTEIYKFNCSDADLYVIEDTRVYAYLNDKKLAIKERLYTVEELVGSMFVKINQSCIVKVSEIKKFETSIGGSIRVIMKNGYMDYISRRQLKTVKERIRFKI